ncbi:MAG: hypothetical protein QOD56_1982 [Gammaproteobacteria bacterium]|jgi:hypothetical protein|nr:hypothetical protein [Gammaproteobacteria bacterium]
MNETSTSGAAKDNTPQAKVTYLPFAPPRVAAVGELATLADYRKTTPAVLGELPVDAKTRLFTRKRVVIGFAVAAALHVGLGLAWWLTPPLRLKASYAPERWVHVMPLPKPEALQPVPPPAKDPTPAIVPDKKKPPITTRVGPRRHGRIISAPQSPGDTHEN